VADPHILQRYVFQVSAVATSVVDTIMTDAEEATETEAAMTATAMTATATVDHTISFTTWKKYKQHQKHFEVRASHPAPLCGRASVQRHCARPA
jgi:hypothetical protein